MKNIIKCRAWDGLKMSFWTMNDLCSWDSKDEKPSALDDWMLFTGLLDKNGKEIYEGDLILPYYYGEKGSIGQVVFLDGIFAIQGNRDLGTIRRLMFDGPGKKFEVIGNIYENPELLTIKDEL